MKKGRIGWLKTYLASFIIGGASVLGIGCDGNNAVRSPVIYIKSVINSDHFLTEPNESKCAKIGYGKTLSHQGSDNASSLFLYDVQAKMGCSITSTSGRMVK